MTITLDNIFSENEIEDIKSEIISQTSVKTLYVWDELKEGKLPDEVMKSHNPYVQNVSLGKVMIRLDLPQSITDKVLSLCKEHDPAITYHGATYTEYDGKYGVPRLSKHRDRFKHFLLLDYQLDANTSWPLYVEDSQYDLSNNSAILFYPGDQFHGRIDKSFENGEYVKMIFFDLRRDNV